MPAEFIRVDSNQHPGRVKLVHFHGVDEVAGVNKVEAEDTTLVVVGVRPSQHKERVVLVAGSSPQAADALHAGA